MSQTGDPSAPDFWGVLSEWDGIGAVVRYDRPTGAWIFIALHDDTLGAPTGGCRMKVYDRPEDGLWDALRLAEGMTYKWASIGFDFGGGKSVLAIPHPLEGAERTGLLRRFGALLNTLSGSYNAGEDLGTTPEDMQTVSQVTPHVVGLDPSGGKPEDPGPYTALGVFVGIQAALEQRFGSAEMGGRTVLVQGVGDVGAPLARSLSEAGAEVLVVDLDAERAATFAAEIGGRVVEASAMFETECDVYAPCAIGATVNPNSIPLLRCAIVAGSANNQLLSDADAQALKDRGILYAPDYVINAGGAMAFALIHQGISDGGVLRERVSSLREALAEIFREADTEGTTPLAAARSRVDRILHERRQQDPR